MEINTHGFEVDENEHAVVDKVYNELTPMLNPSPMVRFLRNRAGDEHKFKCIDSEDWRIADYIEQLEAKLEKTEKTLDIMNDVVESWEEINKELKATLANALYEMTWSLDVLEKYMPHLDEYRTVIAELENCI